MRCKLGPASFAAGTACPNRSSLSPLAMSPLSRLRWSPETPRPARSKKMYTSTPVLEVKIRCPGTQARTESATSWIPPRASLPASALEPQLEDTRAPQVTSENGRSQAPSVVAPSPAAKRASRSRTGCLRIPHRYVLWPFYHRLHDLLVLFANAGRS